MLHSQSSKPAGGGTALVYITLGALLTVWSGIWFAYERSRENATRGVDYICAGLLLTGIALLVIGFVVGHMAHKVHAAQAAQEEAKADAIEKNPAMAHKI